MTDRKVLKTKIERLDDDPKVWKIIEDCLDEGDANCLKVHSRLMDHYDGDNNPVNPLVWEVSDWLNS